MILRVHSPGAFTCIPPLVDEDVKGGFRGNRGSVPPPFFSKCPPPFWNFNTHTIVSNNIFFTMLKLEMCFVNIYIQNSLTKYGFFFIVFFPHARPPPPLKKYKNEGLFLQSCSLKCVLPIFIIYNIALQNKDFGVLHKSSKHFMISIFFPRVEGDTPVPPPLGTSCFEQQWPIVFTIL